MHEPDGWTSNEGSPSATTLLDTSMKLSEDERVLCWRLVQLDRAGYKDEAAATLALRLDVDLHQAIDLLRRGCAHETALRILL